MTPQQFNRLRADAITNAEKHGTTTDGKAPRGEFTTREARETYAKQCGVRYAVAGLRISPRIAAQLENPPVRRDYCEKEPPLPDDSDFFRGGVRPFDAAHADSEAEAEATMRQLKAEVAELRELETLARAVGRKERAFFDKQERFEKRHGRPWRYVAESYFPEDAAEEDAEGVTAGEMVEA